MKNLLILIRNELFRVSYIFLLKPILFCFDPEKTHDFMTRVGVFLGKYSIARWKTKLFFSFSHPSLEQDILGIHFQNPVGLAAGFDKDALLTDILLHVGFGFEEVGSITGEECAGNKGLRLWRLKKSKALVVNYGLKNDGCEKISKRLKNKKFEIPIGISIAKTNSRETREPKEGIYDYL